MTPTPGALRLKNIDDEQECTREHEVSGRYAKPAPGLPAHSPEELGEGVKPESDQHIPDDLRDIVRDGQEGGVKPVDVIERKVRQVDAEPQVFALFAPQRKHDEAGQTANEIREQLTHLRAVLPA